MWMFTKVQCYGFSRVVWIHRLTRPSFELLFEFEKQLCLPQVVQNHTFMSRFNDSELSKMDMGPLWAEILDYDEAFSLVSAHDSTIYPLMTSLGEKVWNATDFPAYASMMILEVRKSCRCLCVEKFQNK